MGRNKKWDEPTKVYSYRCPESMREEMSRFIASRLNGSTAPEANTEKPAQVIAQVSKPVSTGANAEFYAMIDNGLSGARNKEMAANRLKTTLTQWMRTSK